VSKSYFGRSDQKTEIHDYFNQYLLEAEQYRSKTRILRGVGKQETQIYWIQFLISVFQFSKWVKSFIAFNFVENIDCEYKI